MPLPMMLLSTSATSDQRPRARTRVGGEDSFIEWAVTRRNRLRKLHAPQRHALLRSGVGAGGEIFEDIVEPQAALEPALRLRIDFGVQLDDRGREGRGALEFLRGGPCLLGRERFVLYDGVELFEIGAGDVAPEFSPGGGLDAGRDEIHEALFVALLLPETDGENEGFVDGELAERIAEIDRGAVFDGLRVHGHAAVIFILGGRDVPFLRVVRRAVAGEKRVINPLLEHEAVPLDLLGRRDQQPEAQPRKHQRPTQPARGGDQGAWNRDAGETHHRLRSANQARLGRIKWRGMAPGLKFWADRRLGLRWGFAEDVPFFRAKRHSLSLPTPYDPTC